MLLLSYLRNLAKHKVATYTLPKRKKCFIKIDVRELLFIADILRGHNTTGGISKITLLSCGLNKACTSSQSTQRPTIYLAAAKSFAHPLGFSESDCEEHILFNIAGCSV